MTKKFARLFRDSGNIIIWVLGLAMLSVGARNFEDGLNLDAPLYAKIAEYLAESIRQGGDWILLNGGTPDFVPFVEHTHGAFWLQAILFQFLPQEDWIARLMGHLFYVGSLLLIYSIAKRYLGEKSAVWSVLILVVWPMFSNFHSTFYLDPGVLFFGMLFLWSYSRALLGPEMRLIWAVASGVCLALCFLIKGMTIFVFGLPAAALGIFAFYSELQKRSHSRILARLIAQTFVVLGVFAAGFGVYWYIISQSAVPDFLERYWERQFTNRFARSLSWGFFFNAKYWKQLLIDTHGMLLLLPVVLWKVKRSHFMYFLFFCVLSISLVYTYGGRVGGQYWLLIMPPLAMLIGGLFGSLFRIRPERLRAYSLSVALALVCIIQYLPFPTHYSRIPAEAELIAHYSDRHAIPDLVLNVSERNRDFIFTAPFSWYGGVKILYGASTALKDGKLKLVSGLTKTPLVYRGPEGAELNYSMTESFMLLDFLNNKSPLCQRLLESESGERHLLMLVREFPNAALYVPRAVAEQVPVRCASHSVAQQSL